MTGQERRQKILLTLTNSKEEISASDLAKKFSVSRQVIVGDIALLRATGTNISAYPKGYLIDVLPDDYKMYRLIVKHLEQDTELELKTLIKFNIIIQDVTINHPSYGLLKGDLNIKTLDDIKNFLKNKQVLLSSLTDGIHVHTLLYKDKKDLAQAIAALEQLGFIYND